MKNKTIDPLDFWDYHRGTIRSRKGGWKIGQGIFSHGYNMMEDLVGKKSYFQVMVLHATGKMMDKALADQVEAAFICHSWPDPRIWCNHIGALGGTMRTPAVAATAAGILAADAKIYGPRTMLGAMQFIQQALKDYQQGMSAEEIVEAECKKYRGKPYIMGFARPIAKGDERIEAMERFVAEVNFPIGQHQLLAKEIDAVMAEKYGENINITGYAAAVMSDHDFTPQEVYQLSVIVVSSGIIACTVEALERPAGAFLPLRCDDIDYQGPPPREVPDRD